MLTTRMTWSPLPGSAPSNLFKEIAKSVTALIDVRMLLSGIVPLKRFMDSMNFRTARITRSPFSGSAPSK
eukprot:1231936-Amphidinium_carterae.1